MSKLDKLKLLTSRIEKIHVFAKTLTEQTGLHDVETRLDHLEVTFREYLKDELEFVKLPDVPPASLLLEDKYLEAKSLLRKAMSENNKDTATTQMPEFNSTMKDVLDTQRNFLHEVSNSRQSNTVKLPRINIPIFSGEYKEWPAFHDLFNTIVHSNNSISKAQKMQYLKSYTTGEAENVIRHMTISEQNYDIAWDNLVKRFDKKGHIITSFIKSFIEQPSFSELNAVHLRRIANTSDEVIRGLDAVGELAKMRDHWLIYLILNKIDSDTRHQWAKEASGKENPTFNEFLTFLQKTCDALEASQSFESKPRHKFKGFIATETNEKDIECLKCNSNHKLFECDQFKALNVVNRIQFIQSNNMCFNCLRTGHIVSKCRSIYSCRQCKKRHHTLLHLQSGNYPEASTKNYSITAENHATASCEEPPTTTDLSNKSLDSNGEVYTSVTCNSQCSILPTVLIKVADSLGTFQQCRALLDSGSQTNFISESCMQRLKLNRNKTSIQFSGLANTNAGAANGMTHLIVRSLYDSTCKLSMTAYILDKLTAFIPSSTLDINFQEQLKELNLADPQFYKPNQIDLLIGAEFFFHILRPERRIIDNAIIQNTIFGWIISGKTSQTSHLNHSYTTMIISDNDVIDNTLQKFWEIENLPSQKLLTNEEIKAENIYTQTTTRHKTGRLIVTLPFKENHPALGNTYQMALSRLLAMERKFLRDPKLKDDYTKFMKEYVQLGHMRKISEPKSSFNYFLPHHCVFKQSSETTKLRVVFDGSAKPASGSSINPCLLVGPTLQLTLYELLLQFRKYKFGICGDIEKMYRQILVDEKYTKYQNILWRENETEEVGHYRLLTVTYGMASSSFLAVRSLVEIANQNSSTNYAALLNNHFYIDDLLAGADSHTEVILIQSELNKVLNAAGMQLRKWKSNSSELMKTIKDDGKHASVTFDEDSFTAKILCLQWNYKEDSFTFKININSDFVATKRAILSESSRIFDPLGFVAPCTLAIKVLLQQLWLKKLGWDDQIPIELETQWKIIRQNLKRFDNLKIPRYFLNVNSKVLLQGFSDASELGYAAVVYIVSTNSTGHTTAVLAAAKTKVAPLKQISLPRLELCGALLLARLMQSIDKTLKINNVRKIAWTDSTTVLHWLADFPRRWKTFVGNRTAEILSIIPKESWNYIASSDNPADCASRGQNPKDLVQNQLWWNGPKWLQLNESLWPKVVNIPDSRSDSERRTQALCNQVEMINPICVKDEVYELFSSYSTYEKLIRVFAFIFRFIRNCRRLNPSHLNKGQLLVSELEHASRFVLMMSQAKSFAEEIQCLRRQTQLNKKSVLAQLHPFIDQNNLLRVGGRIQKAQTDYDHKHQIILSKECIISTLLLKDIHRKYCHAGATFMINSARLKYWIIGARSLAKRITTKCVICFRQRAAVSNQLMGNLPSARLIHSIRPFVNTGVDYAGPIKLKCDKIRSTKTFNGYIALFICMASKAIHIEAVTDLTTAAFIAALRRFVSRRGLPSVMYSDNGSTFICANKELSTLLKQLHVNGHNKAIAEFLSREGVQWKFNPPYSPHFGGLWEAGVKSIKTHLKKVVGNTILSFEELTTVLYQIEAVLNSRPLCPLEDDIESLEALTPGHFLIGGPLIEVPDPCLGNIQINRLHRWQLIQKLKQDFWRRWKTEYISSLQQRSKWRFQVPNFETNQLVLLKEESLPGIKWVLGRILETIKGDDNMVRVLKIKTEAGEFIRPITKVCLLPSSSNN